MGIFDFAHRVCIAGNVKVKEALEAVKAGGIVRSISIAILIPDENYQEGALILLREATSQAEILAYNRKLEEAKQDIIDLGLPLDATDDRFKQKGKALTNATICGLLPLELRDRIEWSADQKEGFFTLTLRNNAAFTEKDLNDLVWLTLKEKFDRTHEDLSKRLERVRRKVATEVSYESTAAEDEITRENASKLLSYVAKTQGLEANIDFTSEEAGTLQLQDLNTILAAENFGGTQEIAEQVSHINTTLPHAQMIVHGIADGKVTLEMSQDILKQFAQFLTQTQTPEQGTPDVQARDVSQSFAAKVALEGHGQGHRFRTCPPAMGPVI